MAMKADVDVDEEAQVQGHRRSLFAIENKRVLGER